MQQRLKPLKPKKYKGHQVNYIDKKGVQHIELNRGCKRNCIFCHADPDYKVFPVPEIKSNLVQIIGEGVLYDPEINQKIIGLGEKRVHNKVIYYGISQGVDLRLLTREQAELLCMYRFGLINKKAKWYKGIRIAWDWGRKQEELVYKTIEMLVNVGYKRNKIIVFMLVNWKIDFKTCLYKFKKCQEWGVKVDDCTWECTKRNFIPLHWTVKEYKTFRRMVRQHDIDVNLGK